MNEKYRRLCAGDRRIIYNMSQAGKTQAQIAEAVGCGQGTISKELARNRGQRGYRPLQAQRIAEGAGGRFQLGKHSGSPKADSQRSRPAPRSSSGGWERRWRRGCC